MKIEELKRLNDYFKKIISDWETSEENTFFESYLVYEPGVLDLYDDMLSGKAKRKDFLVYSIRDMYGFINENKIPCSHSLFSRFKKEYGLKI